jgi:hypothetical protein
MQAEQHQWTCAISRWAAFVHDHPELGYKSGRTALYNFLRLYKQVLSANDAIRKAKNRFWIAHSERFEQVAFDCATGKAKPLRIPLSRS